MKWGDWGKGRLCLVIGLSSDLRLAAQQQLLAMGAQAIAVTSTAEALRVLNEPYPVEYIMVVDRLPRNSILTGVDRFASLAKRSIIADCDFDRRHGCP